jgi:processive 1,2-diacylglycerol beta-glucosyltransferase
VEGELKQAMKRPRIMVLTLSFGLGHVRAAKTIARELLRQSPNSEVCVVDALAAPRFLFRAGYVWLYWAMVRYAPTLWDRLFSRRLKHRHRRTAPEWVFRFGCPYVFKAIRDFHSDTIVATEVAACEIAVIARRRGLSNARIINVITDYEAEPVWVQLEVNTYAVGDNYVADQLAAWGAPLDKIYLCGIPTAPSFHVSHDKHSTRAKYELNDIAPVVLIMGGGMGPTHMDEVAAALLESAQPIQIVAIAGHDERARRRLGRLQSPPSTSLRVLGWTNDVPALMQVASVLITKPGGLTISEAAISALPLVLFDAIPGPERRNAQRIAATGAGVLTNSTREAALFALRLLHDEKARQRMSARSKRLARPEAATTIARLALNDTMPIPGLARSMTA